MTPLQSILNEYRTISQAEREKGNYFEELIATYFRYEATSTAIYGYMETGPRLIQNSTLTPKIRA
jgi:predicted helicase